ncbi:MAG: hypothetical protein JWQ78_1569, partial [Sediminibacterium sp.]|nr:hypothetical protein [Sediminibacterium sp.]
RDQVDNWGHKVLAKKYDDTNHPRIGSLRALWKKQYQLDLDTAVQPWLFRVLCSYLDQGVSLWNFPADSTGFLSSIRAIEQESYTSFFKGSRARHLLLNTDCSITDLLKMVAGNEAYFEQYLFDQQFSHRGWSGMVATIEAVPGSLLAPKPISLNDLVIFELLLEIDALDEQLGKGNWFPLTQSVAFPPIDLFADVPPTELNEVFTIWQNAFEWSYYDEVMAGITLNNQNTKPATPEKSFQAVFCIDERECSLRRHLENTDRACETLGSPGFFGVEFYFQPQHAKFYDKLCPAPVTPKYLIKEYEVKGGRKHELLYSGKTHTFFAGYLSSLTLGFLAGARIFLNLFRPKMSPAISNAFAHQYKDSKLTIENHDSSSVENGLQIGFTVDEMSARVEGLLRGIGLVKDFAPVVYLVAHGSSSANNPHHGAHDCGACSGRPGSVNARVFAFMANHREVRKRLEQKGILVPQTTQFTGGLHDTAADEIEFYDLNALSETNRAQHEINQHVFEQALDLNAKERSRRFASINTKNDIKKVREAIKKRSVSLFEPRPELGHGTNTLCIVGHRKLTKGLFLDRRAFLNSYDHTTDPEGKYLAGVMRPLGPVCGGINLEYYFSRVDNYKLGAGTKLPHNVMGLFGVANSSDGDLRPGLPLQMIEVHDPVRLLIIVEHFPDVVLKTVQSAPEMYEWFINEWVHLSVIHPETKAVYVFSKGAFIPYSPLTQKIHSFDDVHHLIESSREMETNNIVDATKENLPVYLYN